MPIQPDRRGHFPAENIFMPPIADASLNGKRILVVEDEFLILLDIRHILESAGASIVTASGVADALAALGARGRFDAAVLDLRLDRDSSTPVAERLLAAGVPFVFLTGAPSEASQAQQFSKVPVIGKPFDSATLLAALSHALSGRA
jgi:CheY-like chemotaxis protein